MTLLQRLAGLELLVVTGKGGVGKSTLTAVFGTILADSGARVLLLEVDPRESLYQLLDIPPSDGAIVTVGPGLHVQNLRPRDVMDELVRERLPVGLLVDRVLDSPVYRQFAAGAPGLSELAVLGHALRLVRGKGGDGFPEIDLVVLDAPATGHGVSLLAAPRLVSDAIPEGPVAHMSREIADFTDDTRRCGVVVATAAEEMPVREATELIRELEARLGRRPEIVAVNGLYPADPGDSSRGRPLPALELWRERRRVNEQELRRLAAAWPGPRVELPLVACERGPELIAALSGPVELALGEPATVEAR